MRLPMLYPKSALLVWMLAGSGLSAKAETINFSAFLTEGTCTFNLNKTMLELGTISFSELQPATLVRAQPFTLIISGCTDNASHLTPMVNITGEGITQDGRWLFRAADSTTGDTVGVMLVKSRVPPTFNDTEVSNDSDIPLAAKGKTPPDQSQTFYAGVSCGTTGCASLQAGKLTARIVFQLNYR